MSDYDKQLKFIHGLQPWARNLIFQMPQLPDNLQDLIRMAKRLEDDTVDKKEPGGKVKPTKVGKDNNSWQEGKKHKMDKHVHEKFEPKPNNAQKRGKSKAWEASKPPKDKDVCFGYGKKGHMKKDCSKVVSASTPSERLKPLLEGGFVAKASLRIGCGNPGSGLIFRQGQINDQQFPSWLTQGKPLVHASANSEIVGVGSDESRQPHRGEVCEGRTSSGGASGGECADRVQDVERGRKFYHLRDGRHRCRLGLDVSRSL